MSLFKNDLPTLMGLHVVEVPWLGPVPAIEIRDIKLKDGTPLLSPEFRARENRWWLVRFGTRDVAYFFNGPMGRTVAINPKQSATLKNFTL